MVVLIVKDELKLIHNGYEGYYSRKIDLVYKCFKLKKQNRNQENEK